MVLNSPSQLNCPPFLQKRLSYDPYFQMQRQHTERLSDVAKGMQMAMRTLGAIVLPGQHSVVLGRMPKSGKSGSALEKLRAPCVRKEDAGRAMRSRGEFP